MKPYYDPDSRPQAPPSIEMLDEPPIPDNEVPNDALTNNAKAHKSTGTGDQLAYSNRRISRPHNIYNIERIIKTRKRKGRKQFSVKCIGRVTVLSTIPGYMRKTLSTSTHNKLTTSRR